MTSAHTCGACTKITTPLCREILYHVGGPGVCLRDVFEHGCHGGGAEPSREYSMNKDRIGPESGGMTRE
jgi:hypothetical protein